MKNILFDCERMKYNHTGLYHYCLHLGNALRSIADSQKESIGFFIKPTLKNLFINNDSWVEQHSIHKYILPPIKKFDIWHSTYQGTQYFPFHRRIKVVMTIHDLNFIYDLNKLEKRKKREFKKLQKK